MTEAFLEQTNGDCVGELVRLSQNEMLIGRFASCNIVTEPKFSSVSQRHAILRKTKNGWVIIDVGTRGKGSTYGSYINGNRLIPNQEIILNPGDEIRLGTKLGKYFRYHGEGTISVPSPGNLRGRLSIDVERRAIILDRRPLQISLTRQEFDLLLILWKKPGSVCRFKDICDSLWPGINEIPEPIDADLKVRINTLVYGLRRKLNLALDGIEILESCRGVGYRLCL